MFKKIDSTKLEKFVKFVFKAIIFLLQTVIISITAMYFCRWLEFIFITIGFNIGNYAFKPKYHAPSVLICTLMSTTIFGALVILTPTTQTTLFIHGLLGVLTSYITFRLSDKSEKKKENIKNGTSNNSN
jgi:hypothetical protein